MVNWATAIPLVSLLGVVFTAGVAWQKLAAQKEAIATLSAALDAKIAELRRELERSSASQGERLEGLRSDADKLIEWRAEVKGAERERHRTAAGGLPIQRDK